MSREIQSLAESLAVVQPRQESAPDPSVASLNAETFRSIATKMDLVERLKGAREKGDCPRILNPKELF